MRTKYWLVKMAVVLLCGAMLLGSAMGDDGFYVIPVNALTFKGYWDGAKTYNAKDLVFYNGSTWLSLLGNNLDHFPDPNISPTYWTMLCQKGDTGATGPTGPTHRQPPGRPGRRELWDPPGRRELWDPPGRPDPPAPPPGYSVALTPITHPGGNVGIGTNNPSYPLDIQSPVFAG